MADDVSRFTSCLKMEMSRRLKAEGHYQESLMLALGALLEELHVLGDVLLAFKAATLTASRDSAPPAAAALKPYEPDWLPVIRPKILH